MNVLRELRWAIAPKYLLTFYAETVRTCKLADGRWGTFRNVYVFGVRVSCCSHVWDPT